MPDDVTPDDVADGADEPAPRSRRTWPQRLTIAGIVATAFGAFAAAGVLAAGQWVVSNRNLVVLDTPDEVAAGGDTTEVVVGTPSGGDDPPREPGADGEASGAPTTPPPTFPQVEPEARNFLITGADGNSCIDPDSRFAPAFGDVHQFGDRSDTIMVWRVNPGAGQVAILSFPRDLYVSIDGGSKGRINTAYRRDDPQRLIATLDDNFGIPIDHYVQVDFCAFKRLVDAVGGVEVPFEYPARDTRTGLFVPETGCFNFDGEHALAYVRSRRYQYEDPPGSGNWRTDGTSDLGRIARQQDFLRRTVATVLSRGVYSPSVVSALIETNSKYLTVDSELTVNKMLQFAGVLQSIRSDDIASYQIEASPRTIAGNAVLVPRVDGENMQAILAVFRGEALLADAPEQDPADDGTDDADSTGGDDSDSGTGTSSAGGTDTDGDEDEDRDGPADDAPVGATTTLPQVEAEENDLGVSPPRDVTC